MENAILCEQCINEFPPAAAERTETARAYAPFSYRHPPMKHALWALKFKGNKEVARICAALLYDRLLPLLSDYALYRGVKKPLIVPVPISRRRRWRRGYNQAELIVRELVRIDGGQSFAPACGVLVKIKDVPPQSSLPDKTARMKNIEKCFAVNPNAFHGDVSLGNRAKRIVMKGAGVKNPVVIRGRDIIVLDDIWTTGATFREARRVLKDAGARTIMCVAVAH